MLRLEKRYAKRTHRDAYHGNAEYRDGEYVRTQTPKKKKKNEGSGSGRGRYGVLRDRRGRY